MMDLSLDADAALRAYLPPESWRGEAQHRFVFRTEDGEEEPLLARLARVQPDVNGRRFEHCVLLRPENAQASQVFVAENLWYRVGRREIDSWMTPASARRFSWSLFEQSFNDSSYTRGLSRFWATRDGERDLVLQIGADGWGQVLGFEEPDGRPIYAERFIWKSDYRTSHDRKDLRFLRQKTVNFKRQVRARWSDPQGEVRAAMKWQLLDDAQREAAAFACGNGAWCDLQQVAQWVLLVRLSREHPFPDQEVAWDFSAYGEIAVAGADLFNDEFLFAWRAALVEVFQPANIDRAGKMIGARSLCVWSFVGDSDLRQVRVETPSQHEVLEANLKLSDWAGAHFSGEEARRLLEVPAPEAHLEAAQ